MIIMCSCDTNKKCDAYNHKKTIDKTEKYNY